MSTSAGELHTFGFGPLVAVMCAFLDAGKLYGDVEYARRLSDMAWCAQLPPGAMGVFKHLSLGPFRVPCP